MMKTMREYVSKLTNDQRIQIIKDYGQFERDGHTGDTQLRVLTNDYCKTQSIKFDARYMNDMANTVFRFYADFYLNNVGDLINGT